MHRALATACRLPISISATQKQNPKVTVGSCTVDYNPPGLKRKAALDSNYVRRAAPHAMVKGADLRGVAMAAGGLGNHVNSSRPMMAVLYKLLGQTHLLFIKMPGSSSCGPAYSRHCDIDIGQYPVEWIILWSLIDRREKGRPHRFQRPVSLQSGQWDRFVLFG